MSEITLNEITLKEQKIMLIYEAVLKEAEYMVNKIRFKIDKHIQNMIKICYNIIDLNEEKSILLSIF